MKLFDNCQAVMRGCRRCPHHHYSCVVLCSGGLEVSVKGRAVEDVHLYRRYVHSGLEVIRAPSRGLFHLWTETLCDDEHVSSDSFKLCLCSKALNEASLAQMGELIYQQQIDNHLHKHTRTHDDSSHMRSL